MNQSTFRWLIGEIRSATARTDLTGSYRGICWTLRGRCSPYVTHRSVAFAPCEYGNVLYVQGRHPDEGIALYPRDAPVSAEEADTWSSQVAVGTVAEVPASLLRPLLQTLRDELGGLTPTHYPALCRVVCVRRRLLGWTEEGRPILAEWPASEPEVSEEQGRLEAAAREQPDLLVRMDDADACGLCEGGVREWLAGVGLADHGYGIDLARLAPHLGDAQVRRVCLRAIARASVPVPAVVE